MGSLLSTVSKTYLEPEHGIEIANTGKVYDQYKGSVVKFQSLSLMKPVLLTGKKVFLYRPLLQHLHKIKTVENLWLKYRADILRGMVNKKDVWIPDTDLEHVAYQWICSIIEMEKHKDVLWIKTNDFLENKVHIMNTVCNHFNLHRVTDYSLSSVNVKKMRINGKSEICKVSIKNEDERVCNNHGIILKKDCIDKEVIDLCKTISLHYPLFLINNLIDCE
jgi:ligand-binding sensor domain-containing protein